jgi:hypothetical protein
MHVPTFYCVCEQIKPKNTECHGGLVDAFSFYLSTFLHFVTFYSKCGLPYLKIHLKNIEKHKGLLIKSPALKMRKDHAVLRLYFF